MSLKNKELIEKRESSLISSRNLLHNEPFVIDYAKGNFVFDEEGNKYLDMLGGFSVVSLGHSNENILNATKNQLDKMIHSTQVFLNRPIIDLADKLHNMLGNGLEKSFFLNSGSEANEMALALAINYTKKTDILYMQHSLHGRTFKTLNVTNMTMWHPFKNMNNEELMVKTYYSEEDLEKQMEVSLRDCEEKLKTNNNIAAFIIEPIQGNGGVNMPHKDYFKKLHKLLKQYGVLLILDEAQTGLGRLGTLFGHNYFDFTPDILMISKALGQGIPISAVTTTKEIANTYLTPNASTTGGNMVSCATALAVLNEIDNKDIVSHVSKISKYYNQKITTLNSDLILSFKGVGLMRGIKLQDDYALKLVQLLKDEGVIIGVSGVNREVLLIEPPLTITESELDFFFEKLDKVLLSLGV